MISTITTTVTTVAILATSATLGVLATLLFMSLLSTREITLADNRQVVKHFGQKLNTSILPLLIVFSLVVILRVLAVI